MYKVGVFHPGTQHSWQTAYAFQETNELQWYLTSIYFSKRSFDSRLINMLPMTVKSKLIREMSRRNFHSLDDDKVHLNGVLEWIEVLCHRLGYRNFAEKADWLGNKYFYRHVKKLHQSEPVDILWGYNNVSLESFHWAKSQGIKTILDQTIGHPNSYNKIIKNEQKSFQDYFFENINYGIPAAVAKRNQMEAELADLVVVGSDFCADTMIKNGCSSSKIRVVPYGFDEKIFTRDSMKPMSTPMRFLFVGSMIPRKGIHYLIEVFKKINLSDAVLDIVGGIGVPECLLRDLPNNIRVYGSVPRTEVVGFFESSDVFVFPSLFEGGGIVLYEACAAGLAIIQSNACGDGVREGNGVILDEVSVDALYSAVLSFINDREAVQRMKSISYSIRGERSWLQYRQDIRSVVRELV